MSELFLGMISGTSVDGADVVLAELGAHDFRIQHAATTTYPAALEARIRAVIENPHVALRELGGLDHAVGRFFADCARDALRTAGCEAADVRAIGHHGQTIHHAAGGAEPFTMQIGDPNLIAALTGITTVADFRRLDMALGGQGAPLVPAFHAWRFAHDEPRVVVNIGGIANITVLDARHPVLGFDTGPGNTLLDLWVARCRQERYDEDGAWGATGRVHAELLAAFLTEPYFAAPPPKSTGRELFHRAWLDRHLGSARPVADVDVQATLAELTAVTIAAAIAKAAPRCARILVCGGGAHNADLLARLQRLTKLTVERTDDHGVPADWVEAAAFAWLAKARLERVAGNLPSVTGARRAGVLGGVYWGSIP